MKMKNIQEGIIETTLGTVVTGIGAIMSAKRIAPKTSSGIVGFGIAHIVLGSIDLIQDKMKGCNYETVTTSNHNSRLSKIHKNMKYGLHHTNHNTKHNHKHNCFFDNMCSEN